MEASSIAEAPVTAEAGSVLKVREALLPTAQAPFGSVSTSSASLERTIVDYWDERSASYSNSVWDELRDAHFHAWHEMLAEKLSDQIESAGPTALKVLDLGCGPGFFEILLSRMGCMVHAVDSSTQMLARACDNVLAAGKPDQVEFFCSDVAKLPFVSDVYDVVISRNVTWLMKDPMKAYAEWQRVLKPGGKLLVFDANWYTYLADEALDRARLCDQIDPSVLNWSDNSFASSVQEQRCERIARELPHTYHQRPAWDLEALSALGFTAVSADQSVYTRVWNEGEQAFYATSPLFAIEAVKAH